MSEGQTYTYHYWRPAVTVDNVVFCFDGKNLKVLLVQRKNEPYKNCWAFPGGFLEEKETLEEAAKRELLEETGLVPLSLTQIGAFSAIDRDPRERVITTAFFSIVHPKEAEAAVAGDDAAEVSWFNIKELPTLAFDHAQIFSSAFLYLKIHFHFSPIGFSLLGDTFTLSDMYRLHISIFQCPIDRRNFQKKFLKLNLILPVEDAQNSHSPHSPKLYKFNREGFNTLLSKFMKP